MRRYGLEEVQNEKRATCRYCNTEGLVWRWDHKKHVNVLFETEGKNSGYEHECEGRDIRQAKCRFCDAQGLMWIRRDRDKFELTESYGLPHACPEIKKIYEANKEALRIDYAFEKKWIKSIEDGYQCKKCNGVGYLKNRNYRNCKKCKGIGTFSPAKKKVYLKALRKKYWPYNGAWMKWKKMGT